MTSSLETIRYHSGIAGEEVADMVDSLEQEVSTLREQVEKLTEECVVLRASSRSKLETIANLEWQVEKLTKQLAALAEQNTKFRKVLLRLACLGNGDQYGNSIGNCIAQEALSLPDLATPAINRIKAEAYRECAEICEDSAKQFEYMARGEYGPTYDFQAIAANELAEEIAAKADELEGKKGKS